MEPKQVLNDFQSVILDDGLDTKTTYRAGDSFSVNRIGTSKYVRLVGLDAVMGNESVRLATIDGTTGSVSVTLDNDTIMRCYTGNCIEWNRHDNVSLEGILNVRPVFEYAKDVTVKVNESRCGDLYLADPNAAALLWNFNSDSAMSSSMGKFKKARIEYAGGKDAEGNDYYTFTAAGDDPLVSVDMPVSSVNDIQWVKVRARNLSEADAIELYACTGNNSNVNANTCTHIKLEKDTGWHEYIVNIPEANVLTANAVKGAKLTSTAWTGKINWIRLDPMEAATSATPAATSASSPGSARRRT